MIIFYFKFQTTAKHVFPPNCKPAVNRQPNFHQGARKTCFCKLMYSTQAYATPRINFENRKKSSQINIFKNRKKHIEIVMRQALKHCQMLQNHQSCRSEPFCKKNKKCVFCSKNTSCNHQEGKN